MRSLSLVIPIYNEEDNISPLLSSIKKALKEYDHEIIFVDDGSTDQTIERILQHKQANITLVKLSRNFGQTSAMRAGINRATKDYIVTLDGDLQNDPEDIPTMLRYLEKNKLDIVTGIRKKRQDNPILTNIPSRIGNFLIRRISKIEIEDFGCTLKIFKSHIAKELDLYGELHRFIPILASLNGAKIGAIAVKHHKRSFGQSKYNVFKTFKVISDLLLMYFFIKYRQKPMHLFGNLGIMFFAIGGLIEFYLLLLKLGGESIGARPLFYVGILFLVVSVQFFTTGFQAELLTRTYFDASGKTPYKIEKVYIAGKESK